LHRKNPYEIIDLVSLFIKRPAHHERAPLCGAWHLEGIRLSSTAHASARSSSSSLHDAVGAGIRPDRAHRRYSSRGRTFYAADSLILSGEMAVAYFTAHAHNSFYPMLNKGEIAVLYCFVFLYLAVAGGGPLSLDRLRHRG